MSWTSTEEKDKEAWDDFMSERIWDVFHLVGLLYTLNVYRDEDEDHYYLVYKFVDKHWKVK